MTIQIHLLRIDGVVHGAMTTRSHTRRGRGHRVICGMRIDHDAQHLAPHGVADPRISPPIGCDVCLGDVIALDDLMG